MITRDLFELAHLDVLGLLDDDERREFEQAFREAPPALQAQIRREQLRVTDIDEWLPKAEAPASLKPRVMGAVREAIEAVRAGEGRRAVRAVGPFALALQRNVSPLWRAAALGFAAATLFVGYQFLNSVSRFNQVTRLVQSEAEMAVFNTRGGAGFARVLNDPKVTTVAFSAGPGAPTKGEPRAGLYSAAGVGAYLYCSLPKTPGGYRLVAVADDGVTIAKEIARFEPGLGQQVIVLPSAIAPGTKLAILPQNAGDDLASALLISRA